jgi:hypothetical protein
MNHKSKSNAKGSPQGPVPTASITTVRTVVDGILGSTNFDLPNWVMKDPHAFEWEIGKLYFGIFIRMSLYLPLSKGSTASNGQAAVKEAPWSRCWRHRFG